MSSSNPAPNREKNKRRGAPLSCAECRRLKLRCSRVFPCASCVKKGCAAICPEGSLTTGKGNRFVLANTEQLHDKISVLANRVRQLEDALYDAHSTRSKEQHPLLTEELLQLKRPLERESADAAKDPDAETTEAIDAVGSLSITDSGHSSFYGITANAWYLLQIERGEDEEGDASQIPLPTDIPWLSHTFPFSANIGPTITEVQTSLLALLPDVSKARRLAELYYNHAAWMYTPIPEGEFYGTIFARFYERHSPIDQDPIDSHRLAVLFLVLGMGTLLDLDLPALSQDATQYYQLGRAALSLDSILESQSVPAIQALLLMCHYMFLSFIEGPRWALMGLAVKLAQSLGLHRDSNKWNLGPDEAFKRRSLMWELFTYDSWQSLTYGRPPSFSMAFIDCQMAYETTKNENDEVEMSFAAWKHRFSSRCQSQVHEQAFGARVPSYKSIQELDKKVRDFYIPPSLRVPGFGTKLEVDREPPSLQLTMQRHIAWSIREMTIFYMHRGFFAKAVEDDPEDPLGSKYGPSFLAAYNSATAFVGCIKSLYSQHPALTERMWFLFTHVFSCAIVLGSIATKCPTVALARSALSHLESACGLFEEVARMPNARAAKVVPVLLKVKAKAITVMSETQASGNSLNRTTPDVTPEKFEEEDDLSKLGGKTRLVSRKSPSVPSSPQATSSLSPELHSQPFATSPVHSEMNTGPQNHVEPMMWTPYPQNNSYQHAFHNEIPEQWYPEQTYGQMQAMDIQGMAPYPGYIGHVSPTHNPYASPQADVHEGHMHGGMPTTELESSWRNLFAQFNQ